MKEVKGKSVLAFSVLMVLVIVSSAFVTAEVTPQPNIQVTLLNQDPDPVKQGDVVEVRFKIENTGIATADSVQVQIDPDYPFSLYSGKSIRDIGKLRAGQTGADAAIVDYKLKVDKEAVEGDNEIELKVKMGDAAWQAYDEDDFLIDVEEYEFPEIKVYVKDSTINRAGQIGEVVIEIANTNQEDVKFLQINLLQSEDYELISASDYVYIGDVDSDDTETEEFEIYVNPGVKEDLILPVQLEYQDTNEKAYKEEYMLKLRLFGPEDAKKLGLAKGSNFVAIGIVVLALIIAGYFYWKRKKKR